MNPCPYPELCLRKRHPVLGAVVGHITDLEAIVGQPVMGSTRLST